ncbi:MAG: phospholipid carrier-dependent glycosyltransferase [Acidobacteriota bacterium]|nr:phospholipid carrier-dependent glycosyltransferase [Blastocatellia bacterium]MDW8411993.1 phospholipid carrier-dependent glycosyltransferase [Acidobacteriota bacterium]
MLRAGYEVLSVVLLIGCFILLEAYGLGFYPLPWKDESWLMQPAYELAEHGRIALPMFRHLGNSVDERIYTDPVFTLLLAGWFKLFGFGMTVARAFNLLFGCGVLVLVFLLCRELIAVSSKHRYFAVLAVALLVFDNNFFTCSRFLRNDLTCLFFCLLSSYFYLCYRGWPTGFVSGLSAALAVLSHLNGLYQFVLLGLWTLLDDGVSFFKRPRAWALAAGICLIMLPYVAVVYNNRVEYLAQWNLFSKGRARGITPEGMVQNFTGEYKRYRDWNYGVMVGTNHAVTLFKLFTLFSGLYLTVAVVLGRHKSRQYPQAHLLLACIWIALFFAFEVTNKTHSYLPHLTVWFAQAVAVTFANLAAYIDDLKSRLKVVFSCVLVLSLGLYFAAAVALPISHFRYARTLDSSEYEYFVAKFRQLANGHTLVASPRHWYLFYYDRRFLAFSKKLAKRLLEGYLADESLLLVLNEREQRKLKSLNTTTAVCRLEFVADFDSPYGRLAVYKRNF